METKTGSALLLCTKDYSWISYDDSLIKEEIGYRGMKAGEREGLKQHLLYNT